MVLPCHVVWKMVPSAASVAANCGKVLVALVVVAVKKEATAWPTTDSAA